MRKRLFTIIVLLSVTACSTFASVTAAKTYLAPTHTLRAGDQSIDVQLLQILLNTTSSTRVAESGIGSPGAESDFFGLKTFDAVKRFQSLHAAEVLYPQGLASPTGVVGAATLQKLQTLAVTLQKDMSGTSSSSGTASDYPSAAITPATNTPLAPITTLLSSLSSPTPTVAPRTTNSTSTPAAAKPIPKPVPLRANMQIPAGVNPNSINLEYFIATVDAAGKKRGMNDTQLQTLEASLRATAATSTDFRKQFFVSGKFIATTSPVSTTAPSALDAMWVRVLSFFGLAPVAQAAVDAPFGGAIYYIIPCTCSGNVLLAIEPLPPTYAALLDYVPETQLFLSYNLPASPELLGMYTPGVQACYQYAGVGCVAVPNEGLITPIVGSAPLPI